MVNTFLPYPDFVESAKALDYRRLGKQRVEAMQIINVLEDRSKGWQNHPAVRMWMGYTECLKEYCNVMIDEWISRGYKNTMVKYIIGEIVKPEWLGREEFHLSHQAALVRKYPEYYTFPLTEEQKQVGYVWPSGGVTKATTITIEDVKKWLENPTVNPQTGRKINPISKTGVASKYRKRAEELKMI